ncbi:MAG: phosphate regulon transcriptional regulator PhoB [Sutterellaceae bacterium]|nr:phosphate regulon transcriptional regulator PhoB [Burkholderiaceae bacterium]MCX7901749.1 phosphate regulon transcriptional regulator PhoB [Burkholderiaceae bacterium]MDW8430453.1 phosphate regulon transcriptional regulator PhoB [Sutterellaceae bacterium]
MSVKILVVEDEPAIQELLRFACATNGFAVRVAESARGAQHAIREALPDLVLLDWMLPDRSGVELLRELRGSDRTRHLPVIMLTAKGAESDRVSGLDAGADDYVVKPFSPRELVARIRAVFRRRAPDKSGEPIRYGALLIDPARHEVRFEDRPVKMGMAEYKLLKFLASHAERVFSRSQLLDGVWGDHVFIDERTVDVHVLRLRKALATVGAQHLIQTVRGLGYRLAAGPSS